jgi:hypothetical protein
VLGCSLLIHTPTGFHHEQSTSPAEITTHSSQRKMVPVILVALSTGSEKERQLAQLLSGL